MSKAIVLLIALCVGIGFLTASPAFAIDCNGSDGQDRVTDTLEIDDITVEIEIICIHARADLTVTVEFAPFAAVENAAGVGVEAAPPLLFRFRESGFIEGGDSAKWLDETIDFPDTRLPLRIREVYETMSNRGLDPSGGFGRVTRRYIVKMGVK